MVTAVGILAHIGHLPNSFMYPMLQTIILKLLFLLQLLEMFGAGTAAVVTPVGEIHYEGQVVKIPTMEHEHPLTQRLFDAIKDIQYGRVQSEWNVLIE